jgi:hypothetical protein
MYQTTNGKVFIETIPGNYYGDTIYFAGVKPKVFIAFLLKHLWDVRLA